MPDIAETRALRANQPEAWAALMAGLAVDYDLMRPGIPGASDARIKDLLGIATTPAHPLHGRYSLPNEIERRLAGHADAARLGVMALVQLARVARSEVPGHAALAAAITAARDATEVDRLRALVLVLYDQVHRQFVERRVRSKVALRLSCWRYALFGADVPAFEGGVCLQPVYPGSGVGRTGSAGPAAYDVLRDGQMAPDGADRLWFLRCVAFAADRGSETRGRDDLGGSGQGLSQPGADRAADDRRLCRADPLLRDRGGSAGGARSFPTFPASARRGRCGGSGPPPRASAARWISRCRCRISPNWWSGAFSRGSPNGSCPIS